MVLSGVLEILWTVYVRIACISELLIETHLTVREKILLLRLAKSSAGKTYVEIGSYLGASACFISRGLCLALKSEKARLYCVDTWMNDAMTEGKRDTYQQFVENTRKYADIITVKRGRSDEVSVTIYDNVDFLFIDGDHTYEGVTGDIRAWFPKLSPGATIVFHDYGWAEGVRRAVEEYVVPLEAYPGKIIDNMYWTALGK